MTKLPRLPRQKQLNVSRCHGCHAKRRWMSPSATPAAWNEGGCHQVPCLPRKVPRRHQRPIRAQARHQSQPNTLSATHATPATWNKVDVTKRHACQAKCRGVTGDQSGAQASQPSAPSATPATQYEGGCRQVPCLPRETKVDVAKCHACHVKRRWMSPSATPATWNEGGCHQVPSLPRKVPRCHRRPIRAKRATRASQVP